MTGYPTLSLSIKLQIPLRASLAVCRSLSSDDIFERDNADHSLFHESAPAADGDLLHASTFQPQQWFGPQSNRRFCDSVPFGRVRSSDRGRNPRLCGSAHSPTPYRVTGRSYRSLDTKLSPQIGAHRKLPAPKPRSAKFLPHRAQFL